ncbi:hypothetical protein C8R45DRAFT_1079926 [Mycena sanguinolenta]|nr:hypothetical protein C8R45DRAFT_1079926 [Mycena sanguinolenta]
MSGRLSRAGAVGMTARAGHAAAPDALTSSFFLPPRSRLPTSPSIPDISNKVQRHSRTILPDNLGRYTIANTYGLRGYIQEPGNRACARSVVEDWLVPWATVMLETVFPEEDYGRADVIPRNLQVAQSKHFQDDRRSEVEESTSQIGSYQNRAPTVRIWGVSDTDEQRHKNDKPVRGLRPLPTFMCIFKIEVMEEVQRVHYGTTT